MKTPASSTALMCFSHPEFSRPQRKSAMEGAAMSPTETETGKRHFQRQQGITRQLSADKEVKNIQLSTIYKLLLAVSHDMDVFYANELQFYVSVVVFILIALPCGTISHGIQLEIVTKRVFYKILQDTNYIAVQCILIKCDKQLKVQKVNMLFIYFQDLYKGANASI